MEHTPTPPPQGHDQEPIQRASVQGEQDCTMLCCKCSGDVGELGGTQMTDCHHVLCLVCIKEEMEKSFVDTVKCPGTRGFFLCKGFISHEDLEHLVEEVAYAEYLDRISSAAAAFEDVGAGAISSSGDLKPNDLKLSEEEAATGFAHKAAIINDLTRHEGLTCEEALAHIDYLPILETRGVTSCKICLDDEVPAGDGVVLKDCLHMFCKTCLKAHIEQSENAEVQCPFVVDDFQCDEPLKGSEIRALVNETEFRRHFEELSLNEAESSMRDVFHCLTPNCQGFWIAEENLRVVHRCEICRANNCLSCKIIHRGTCEEYQQEIADERNRTQQQINDRLSADEINRRLGQRQFMRCPQCNVVIEKNQGCAHMTCGKCRHSFNWTGVPS